MVYYNFRFQVYTPRDLEVRDTISLKTMRADDLLKPNQGWNPGTA